MNSTAQKIIAGLGVFPGDIVEVGDIVAIKPSYRGALLTFVSGQKPYERWLARDLRLSMRHLSGTVGDQVYVLHRGIGTIGTTMSVSCAQSRKGTVSTTVMAQNVWVHGATDGLAYMAAWRQAYPTGNGGAMEYSDPQWDHARSRFFMHESVTTFAGVPTGPRTRFGWDQIKFSNRCGVVTNAPIYNQQVTLETTLNPNSSEPVISTLFDDYVVISGPSCITRGEIYPTRGFAYFALTGDHMASMLEDSLIGITDQGYKAKVTSQAVALRTRPTDVYSYVRTSGTWNRWSLDPKLASQADLLRDSTDVIQGVSMTDLNARLNGDIFGVTRGGRSFDLTSSLLAGLPQSLTVHASSTGLISIDEAPSVAVGIESLADWLSAVVASGRTVIDALGTTSDMITFEHRALIDESRRVIAGTSEIHVGPSAGTLTTTGDNGAIWMCMLSGAASPLSAATVKALRFMLDPMSSQTIFGS